MPLAVRAGLVVLLVLGLTAAAIQPVSAAGSRAPAAASVRVVSAGIRFAATPMTFAAVTPDRASAAGSFTVSHPGQATPWFLTLRADSPSSASIAVSFRPSPQGAALKLDAHERTVASGAAGQFVVPGHLEIVAIGPVPPNCVTHLTASVTCGP